MMLDKHRERTILFDDVERECSDKYIMIILPSGNSLSINLEEEQLDWKIEEVDEREMGVERLYEAALEKGIAELSEPLVVDFRVWEYPEGFVNMQEVEVSEGQIIKECDLGQFVISYYDEDEYEN